MKANFITTINYLLEVNFIVVYYVSFKMLMDFQVIIIIIVNFNC